MAKTPAQKGGLLSTTAETSVEIRPFHVDIPEEELDNLRGRIAAMRWPERETAADEQGGFDEHR